MTTTNGTGTADALRLLANINSVLTSRLAATGGLGYQFNGNRDLYTALGYRREISPEDYLNAYRRGSIAGRGIDLAPEDTWKRKAVIIDGQSRSDEQKSASPFIRDWQRLVDKHQLWHRFKRADILGRLGRYAILLLGVRDGQPLDSELTRRLGGPDDLLYVRPYYETSAVISTWDEVETSPRYGLPLTYQVKTSNRGGTKTVHYSRVLHVADGLLEDDVYGLPALESVYNRLDDLEKTVGGSSEAFWLNIRKGLALLAREGVDLPTSTEDKAAFDTEVENYIHNLSRVMRLSGVDVQDLGADVVDGYQQFKMLVSIIAADLDIPQRKLIGNEQGERASSQDERNWAAKIKSRQTDFAEPLILRAFIDWCVKYGLLPAPASGAYQVEWPAVYEPTAQEEADTALTVAQALNTAAGGLGVEYAMPLEDYTERYLHYVPPATPRQVIAGERGQNA